MKTRNLKLSGFTLVEIMIVVAIIGLLSAIAIPNFVRARRTSQVNTCINNLRQIDGAKQLWALENGGTAAPVANDIAPYMGSPFTGLLVNTAGGIVVGMINCPAAGTYSINALDAPPECTTADHVLP